MKPQTPDNEVARLRELLNRAIEIADEAITPLQRSEYKMDGDMLYRQLERLRDELSRLAPAPEEPVTALCLICHEKQTTCSSGLCEECKEPVIQDSRITEPEWRIKSPKEHIEDGDEYERNYFWLPVPSRWVGQLVEVRKPKIRTRRPLCPFDAPTDLNQQNKENTPSLNDWRELGQDEVIQRGDESSSLPNHWNKCVNSVGATPKDWPHHRFCTRRPLPNSHESEGIKKQEEMPLEDELKDIDQYADKQNDFYTCRVFQSIEYALHHLRDEIQKLKENK